MKTLVLNAPEVLELLPIRECIAVMREALIALAAGKVHQPLRTIIRPPDAKGVMGLMPSYKSGEGAAMSRRQKAESRRQSAEIGSGESASGETASPPAHAGGSDKAAECAASEGGGGGAFGLKAICVFPGNPAKGKDSHQGAVLLFSAETGELLAMMNASAITAIRTAAVSGVATDLLARANACNLAIIGSVGPRLRSIRVAELDEVRSAIRLMAERNRIIAEGAGACALACALAGKAGGGRVVCIVSGGNIDFATLCEILNDQEAGAGGRSRSKP